MIFSAACVLLFATVISARGPETFHQHICESLMTCEETKHDMDDMCECTYEPGEYEKPEPFGPDRYLGGEKPDFPTCEDIYFFVGKPDRKVLCNDKKYCATYLQKCGSRCGQVSVWHKPAINLVNIDGNGLLIAPINKTEQRRKKRTIMGTEIVPHSFPWLVEMRRKNHSAELGSQMQCAGALINEQFLLTAGHCLHPEEQTRLGDFFIRLGVHSRQEYDFKSDAEYFREEIGVVQRGIKDYRRADNTDFAIMMLNESVTFTHRISPACMPSKWLDVTDVNGTDNRTFIAGAWGYQHPLFLNENNKEDRLAKIFSPTPMMYASRRVWGFDDVPSNYHVISTMTVGYNERYDGTHDGWFPSTSGGDSGSPLSDYNNGIWEVAGTLKGGGNCYVGRNMSHPCYKNFESVAYQYEWIQETMLELRNKHNLNK